MATKDMYIEVGYIDNQGKVRIDRIYFADMSISNVLSIISVNGNFFRIKSEWAVDWNTFIEDEWGELDDCDYYMYNKPYLCGTEWHTYYDGGHNCTVKEYKAYLKNDLFVATKFAELAN